MKLKLEELMLYGNNLKVLWQGDIIKVEGYDFLNNSIILERVNVKLSDIKPILRPLSDLSKDDFGEYLIEELYTLDFEKQILSILEDIRWVNQCDYLLIQLLIEKHYDVFGLIEKGLAIDINTL
jgi:hypothetical protein